MTRRVQAFTDSLSTSTDQAHVCGSIGYDVADMMVRRQLSTNEQLKVTTAYYELGATFEI